MTAPKFVRAALSGLVMTVSGARVTPADEDQDTKTLFPPQAIYYANHSSHLDFVTIWAAMPRELQPTVRPLAAADYWNTGPKAWAAREIFNAHLVTRHKSTQPAEKNAPPRASRSGVSPTGQMDQLTALLDAGDSIIIFPEGTRGPADQVAEFKSGLYHLARHNPALPVVPVALKNLGKILPKGEILPVPHLSEVVVFPPITVADGEDKEAFLSRAREILLEGLHR